MSGLIGKKIGMTSLYDDNGKNIPCTVIEAGPCLVTQVRTEEVDGYEALQLGFDDKKDKRTSMAAKGHFKKAGTVAKKKVVEFQDFEGEYNLGDEVKIDVFQIGEYVDVAGISKGKGFQGVVKRHGFSGSSRTHGQSAVLRSPGSIGNAATPGRIWKNKKMPGQMGGKKVKVLNLQVLKLDLDKNLIIVKGCVPGHKNAYVTIEN